MLDPLATDMHSGDGDIGNEHKMSDEKFVIQSNLSSEELSYERGVETLQNFFDEVNENEKEVQEDVTNWFLHRLEMRSETAAKLLLSDRSSNRACLDHLAERARLARAEIGADMESVEVV
eukprot:CAMPEP_0198155064 /NCGR_PEP_ID=MMETSP1443-20131203/68943_1 /TAXON_ID=186043 /ORGANISM="Entomoneis sp., Strain CCMP2396" /LENGTH=119 /DNA_ID=CAMNT_0043821801 /DNA_START=585 /DNA_END=940 /DNA_ORIENTATION=+